MAPDPAFWPYEQIKLKALLTNSTSSTEADATSATLYYENPAGTVTSKALADLTKETTGTYYYLLTPTTSETGEWHWGWKSTGGAIGANYSGRFRVLEPPFST